MTVPPTTGQLLADPRAWDGFVAAAPNGSFPQLDAWARASRERGWSSRRVVVDSEAGPVGAQVLVHRLARTPWGRGYAPRGPVAGVIDQDAVRRLTAELRVVARRERLAHVAIDPALEAGHPVEAWLAAEGWRRAPARQVNRTRLVDLRRPEDALWSDMRSSARWSVNRARRNGLAVVDVGLTHLADVERMYHETAARAGFVPGSFSAVVRAFAQDGDTRIIVARDGADGPLAALVLVPCGERVIEVYGAATAAGTAKRASYLLKWEAMRSSRERGFTTYDMWGADDPGIAEFKAAFGGHQVEYVGAWVLVTDRLAERALVLVQGGRSRISGLRPRARGGDPGAA